MPACRGLSCYDKATSKGLFGGTVSKPKTKKPLTKVNLFSETPAQLSRPGRPGSWQSSGERSAFSTNGDSEVRRDTGQRPKQQPHLHGGGISDASTPTAACRTTPPAALGQGGARTGPEKSDSVSRTVRGSGRLSSQRALSARILVHGRAGRVARWYLRRHRPSHYRTASVTKSPGHTAFPPALGKGHSNPCCLWQTPENSQEEASTPASEAATTACQQMFQQQHDAR